MSWIVMAHSHECENGTCPTVFRDDDTGDVWVRGYLTSSGTAEADVRIPEQEWLAFVSHHRPVVWDEVWVRGYRTAAGEQVDVRIPADDWSFFLPQLSR